MHIIKNENVTYFTAFPSLWCYICLKFLRDYYKLIIVAIYAIFQFWLWKHLYSYRIKLPQMMYLLTYNQKLVQSNIIIWNGIGKRGKGAFQTKNWIITNY